MSSSITLYAQYFYQLTLTDWTPLEDIIFNGEPIASSEALPPSGAAVIYVEKGDGVDWVVSDNGFERVEAGTIVSLEFRFTGADADYSIEAGRGVVTFTYSGPVTLGIFEYGLPVGNGILYDGNGGSFDGNTLLSTDSTTVEDVVPVRQGYDFLSWNTARDGSGESYSSGDIIGSPVTLYAQWGSTLTYIKTADGPMIYDGDNPLGSTKPLPAAGEVTLVYSNGMVNGVSLNGDGFGDFQDGVLMETRAVAVSGSGNEPQVVCYQEGGLNYIKIRYDGSFTLSFEESVADYLEDGDYAVMTFNIESDGDPETYRLVYSYTGKDDVVREFDHEVISGDYLVAGRQNNVGVALVPGDDDWSTEPGCFYSEEKTVTFDHNSHAGTIGPYQPYKGYFWYNIDNTIANFSITAKESLNIG